MTNPIGLTRAEESKEQLPAKPTEPGELPPGAVKCRIASISGWACGSAASTIIVWTDGDRTPACADCAKRMQAMASSYRAPIRVEPLEK